MIGIKEAWWGVLPKPWESGALRRFASIKLGKMIPGQDSLVGSQYPYLRAAHIQPGGALVLADQKTMGFTKKEKADLALLRGDVVVVEGGAGFGRNALIEQDLPDWGFQNSINRLRPHTPSYSAGAFLNYALFAVQQAGVYDSRINTATIPHLTAEKLAEIEIPWPPAGEQSQIVRFLDRETAQIDELIAKQEQLIRSLELRKHAVIRQLVTGSHESRESRILSGHPWWGALPAHWKVGKVGHYFDVTLGKMLDENKQQREQQRFPYIRAANIQEDGLRLEEDHLLSMSFSEPERTKYTLLEDDLLVVEGGAIGVNQYLSESLPDVYFQKTVNRVRSRGEASTRYLGFALDVLRVDGVLDMSTNKSTIAHFTAEKLNQTRIPMPPRDEQDVIVESILRVSEAMANLGRAGNQMITLLKERRQALISAAVTGKIDVTGKA